MSLVFFSISIVNNCKIILNTTGTLLYDFKIVFEEGHPVIEEENYKIPSESFFNEVFYYLYCVSIFIFFETAEYVYLQKNRKKNGDCGN